MVTTIDFLKKAEDYKALEVDSFEYIFNPHRGGNFTDENIPTKVFAYSTEWVMQRTWIDKANGIYSYDYFSKEEPKLPNKILIKKSYSSMPQWSKTEEEVRFYGKIIFEQSDDWGRIPVIWMEGFEDVLETCDTEEQVLSKINEIQKRQRYFDTVKSLETQGYSKHQIQKFLKAKTMFKYENIGLKLSLINQEAYTRELFMELSRLSSEREFNKLALKWGLEELVKFTFPRKSAYAELIYKLK